MLLSCEPHRTHLQGDLLLLELAPKVQQGLLQLLPQGLLSSLEQGVVWGQGIKAGIRRWLMGSSRRRGRFLLELCQRSRVVLCAGIALVARSCGLAVVS